jgi:plasmid rolling circle replication initiator protein Rep
MNREDILELKDRQLIVYNDKIKPLYNQIKALENELEKEYNQALNQYYDKVLVDSDGNPIRVNDYIETLEYNVVGNIKGQEFNSWWSENSLKELNLNYHKTGKTRIVKYICTKRYISEVFGSLVGEPKLYVRRIKNGNILKTEDVLFPERLKDFKKINS